MSYKCNRCGKLFKQKVGLIKHLQKDIPCSPHLSDENRTELISIIQDPFYYKKYIKEKKSREKQELEDRVFTLEQQFEQLQKRYFVHPLEFAGTLNVEDVLSSTKFKNSLYLSGDVNLNMVAVIDLFKKTSMISFGLPKISTISMDLHGFL